MGRLVEAGNSRPQGRHRRRFDQGHRPGDRRVHARQRQRQLPVPRVGVQRADGHHPGRRTPRARPSTRCPTAPAPGSSRPTTRRPARGSCATTPGGAARRRSTRSSTRSSTRPARWSPPTRAARSTPSSSSTSSPARPLFSDPNFTVNEAETTNHRQIWFRNDTGQFTDKRVRQAVALSLDRDAMVAAALPGPRRGRQRPRHLQPVPVLRPGGPAADPRRREGQGAPGRGRNAPG